MRGGGARPEKLLWRGAVRPSTFLLAASSSSRLIFAPAARLASFSMSSGSSSSGSAAAKQLMRGLFLRPTSFQISNMAQSLAVLQHFHRLAQRADAAAAAAAREAGDGARRLEHGGLYSVFVPRVSWQRQ
jgi:hypothetical protein